MLIAVLAVIAAALIVIAFLQWRTLFKTRALHDTVVPWINDISARIGDDRTFTLTTTGAQSVLSALQQLLANQIPVNLTGLHQLTKTAENVLAQFTTLTDTEGNTPT